MFNLLATRRGRLAAFFLLYVTEGIPLGFTATAVATYMRKQGVAPAAIGTFVATLYLPWAWKWIAGPFVDLFYSDRLGRRRAWIVACQALMALTLLAAMPIDFASNLWLFTGVIFIHNVFAAIQDVAIDALAVSVLPPEERGLANGLMFAGAYVGNPIGGAGVLFLAPLIGFSLTFAFVAAAILTITLLVALPLREPRVPLPPEVPPRAGDVLDYEPGGATGGPRFARAARDVREYAVTALRAMFGTRASFAGLMFAVLPAGSYALSLTLASTLAVDLGLRESSIAWLNIATTVLSAVGCVIGGALSDRIGRRRALAIYLVLTALPTAAFGLYLGYRGWVMPVGPGAMTGATPVPRDLVIAFWIGSLAYAAAHGLMYGSRTALFMDLCEPRVAATQFTGYMAVLNLVIAYSAWWQGHSISKFGYPITLLLDAAFGLVAIAVLPLTQVSRADVPQNASDEVDPPFAVRAESGKR
jgi:MFS family permease